MLSHSSRTSTARGFGKSRSIVEAMRPAAPVERAAPWRRLGLRLGETAEGVLLLAVILAVACAYLLLLDHLGVPPAIVVEFPLVD